MIERTTRRRGLLETYKFLIAAVTLLTVAGALLVLTLRPPQYVSTAEVVVRPESLGGGAPLAPNMGTERALALSGDVTALAATNLGLDSVAEIKAALTNLTVSVPVDTTVLDFTYSGSTPQEAEKRAGVFARAYVAYRTRSAGSPTVPTGPDTTPSTPADLPIAALISPPTVPTAPAKPNYPLLLGLALMVGAMLGAGCALVWDRLSGRLRSYGDVETHTGLPVLASVPALKVGIREGIAVLIEPPVRGAEAYGYLTARMAHLFETRRANSLLITSPSDGAGKTTVAVNLATSLAATGRHTVLVSADPHSTAPLQQCFGFDPEPGLTDVLRGTTPLARALHSTAVPDLDLLTYGKASASGETVFNVEDLSLLLQRLAVNDGAVIIDGPSVLGNPEAALLGDKVALVLMVIDMRHGTRADAGAAVSMLSHLDNALVGCVANHPGRRYRRRIGGNPGGRPQADQSTVVAQRSQPESNSSAARTLGR